MKSAMTQPVDACLRLADEWARDMEEDEQSGKVSQDAIEVQRIHIEQLRQLAPALQAAMQGCPEGWVMVPREPTPSMLIPLASRGFTEHWESGKSMQREQLKRSTAAGNYGYMDWMIPPKTEYEVAAGQYIAMLAAAPTQPPAMQGWLSIESAPKDGSMFLCWVSAISYGEDDDGRPYETDVSAMDFCEWRDMGDDDGFWMPYASPHGDGEIVTHWMKPTPPTAAEPGEA